MAATATRLLNAFGQPMTLRRKLRDSYNPITGQDSTGAVYDTTTVGLFQTINSIYATGFSLVSGDFVVVIDASMRPLLTDDLMVSGILYNIIAVQEMNPAGTPIAYRLQVRL